MFNVEEMNTNPFMERLNANGLPWHEQVDGGLEMD
jgi:saccharopine dehydrogenase (NAD+, L-lysine-forming)